MTKVADALAAQNEHRRSFEEAFAGHPSMDSPASTGDEQSPHEADELAFSDSELDLLIDRAADGSEVAAELLQAAGIELPKAIPHGDAGRRGGFAPQGRAHMKREKFIREVRRNVAAAAGRRAARHQVTVLGTGSRADS